MKAHVAPTTTEATPALDGRPATRSSATRSLDAWAATLRPRAAAGTRGAATTPAPGMLDAWTAWARTRVGRAAKRAP